MTVTMTASVQAPCSLQAIAAWRLHGGCDGGCPATARRLRGSCPEDVLRLCRSCTEAAWRLRRPPTLPLQWGEVSGPRYGRGVGPYRGGVKWTSRSSGQSLCISQGIQRQASRQTDRRMALRLNPSWRRPNVTL